MARITIETPNLTTAIEVSPSADFISCLIPALLAAVPAFLESFMKCVGSSPAPGGFNPGNRDRCTPTNPPAP